MKMIKEFPVSLGDTIYIVNDPGTHLINLIKKKENNIISGVIESILICEYGYLVETDFRSNHVSVIGDMLNMCWFLNEEDAKKMIEKNNKMWEGHY